MQLDDVWWAQLIGQLLLGVVVLFALIKWEDLDFRLGVPMIRITLYRTFRV